MDKCIICSSTEELKLCGFCPALTCCQAHKITHEERQHATSIAPLKHLPPKHVSAVQHFVVRKGRTVYPPSSIPVTPALVLPTISSSSG